MTGAAASLLAVAKELAQQAKDSLPNIREGEQIRREWYKNGVYFRETLFDGEIYLSQYDFRRRAATVKRGDKQSLT